MRRTFRYRAVISRETGRNANEWLYLCRKLYNLCLEQRIYLYTSRKVTVSKYDQNRELPSLKSEFPEFRKVGSQCLQDVVERLDKAYQAFFRRVKGRDGKAGFPRFRSVHRYDSFTLKQAGWKLEGRYLFIKNVGRFKLFLSRPIEGKIKTVTVRKTSTGKWFVCFSCDNVPAVSGPETDKAVGIDVGLNSFLVDSDGFHFDNPRFFRKAEQKLRVRQRRLARRKKGSGSRTRAGILVARAYEKITNQRNDFLHKTANYYIEKYQTIAIENLSVRNMVRNHHLAKSISDAGWNTFSEYLAYKAEGAGREIVKVNPAGTSQICFGCGEIVKKSLAVRVHKCPECGLVMDRDENAAVNILVRSGRPFRRQREPSGCA